MGNTRFEAPPDRTRRGRGLSLIWTLMLGPVVLALYAGPKRVTGNGFTLTEYEPATQHV